VSRAANTSYQFAAAFLDLLARSVTMHRIIAKQFHGLVEAHKPPCISLYLPTSRHHPGNQRDAIRYRKLLVKAETSLRAEYPARNVEALLEHFYALARNEEFWRNRTDGLAIFSDSDEFVLVELQRPVEELVVVADTFFTEPLVCALQLADRYSVLSLSHQEARIYLGNVDLLKQMEVTDVPPSPTNPVDEQMIESRRVNRSYGALPRGDGVAVHHQRAAIRDESDVVLAI
jgi:hypothetical protein